MLVEFLQFLAQNKTYWLTPIVFVLLLIGALVILSGGPFSSYIYSLF
jgi:hypothetical protein